MISSGRRRGSKPPPIDGRTGREQRWQRVLDTARIEPLPRGLHARLVDHLARQILCEEAAPGSSLPRIDELAQTFSVSRTVVRDALQVLAAKGLIETRTRRGTLVRPRAHWRLLDPEVLRWSLQCGRENSLLQDLIELRQVIEPAAAQLAAARAGEDDLARIAEACEQMASRARDEATFLEADIAFHIAVLRAARNEAFAQLSQAITVGLLAAFERSIAIPDATALALPLHRAVHRAIEARNPIAAFDAMMVCVRQDDTAAPGARHTGLLRQKGA
jgi:GntR family galactonate operon transcriptional repressor